MARGSDTHQGLVRTRPLLRSSPRTRGVQILASDMTLDVWAASWRRTLSVNLESAAFISFLAARHWLGRDRDRDEREEEDEDEEKRKGRPARAIVMITSRGAYRGEPDAPAYGASKAAMNSMAQSLAKALGGRLNVSVAAVVRPAVRRWGWDEALASARHESNHTSPPPPPPPPLPPQTHPFPAPRPQGLREPQWQRAC